MYLCTHSLWAQAFGTSLFLLSVKTSTHINPKADKGQRNILPWLHRTPAYASFCTPAFCVTIYLPAQRHVLYHIPVDKIQPAGTFHQRYLSTLHLESLYKCPVQKKMQYSSAFLFPIPTSEHINLSNLPTVLLIYPLHSFYAVIPPQCLDGQTYSLHMSQTFHAYILSFLIPQP